MILWLFLVAFQLSRLLHNQLFLSLGQSSVQCIKTGHFSGLLSVCFGRIGRIEKLQEVLILNKMLLNKTFKEAAVSKLFPNACRKLVDLEHVQWISVVESVRHHVRDVHQTGVLLRFLGAKLDLVECLLEKLGIDTVLLYVSEGLMEDFLNLAEIIDFDPLHTDCERCLARCVVESGPWAELWRNLAFNDTLVEGCVRA